MKKRLFLIISLLCIIMVFSYNYTQENASDENVLNNNIGDKDMEDKEIETSSSKEEELEKIDINNAFKNSIVLDTHNDTMMKVVDDETWLPRVNLGESTSFHIDIPKLRKGGLNIPFFAAFTEGYLENTETSISRTLALINALYFTEKNNQDTFKISKNLKDIISIVNEEKIAAVPTIEGAYSLDKDNSLELLNQYNDLGIKAIALTWNYSNKLGEGASRIYGDKAKTPSSGGLTELGEKVVLEMNRLGIIVDISHMDDSTFWDVISISKSPIIASHSGVDNIKTHNRNLTDEQLKALADNGGVISIVFYPEFLKNGDVYIRDMVDHIDYVVNLIGIDHVGIGSDFDGARMPKDLKDSSEIYKIREELSKRNYSDKDMEKILGKNILRVLREVEYNSEYIKDKTTSNIKIIPSYKMGEKIETNTPILTAKVEGKDSEMNSSIIVDGTRYEAVFNEANSNISLEINEPLKEKFHVVTFETKDNNGNIERATRIFYIIGN